MAVRSQPQSKQHRTAPPGRPAQPLRIEELAQMLEIDLACGRRRAFRRRLRRALDEASRQGRQTLVNA